MGKPGRHRDCGIMRWAGNLDNTEKFHNLFLAMFRDTKVHISMTVTRVKLQILQLPILIIPGRLAFSHDS